MRISFLGHACFLLETQGKRVVTDPYSPQIGYRAVNERADFVTLSHHNPKWHSCLDAISGDYEAIRGLDILETGAHRGDLSFGAALVFEKPGEGPNAMVWLESEELRVLHLGDCGVLPDDETLRKCGRVDVMLALAGGPPTLNLDDLMILIEKLQPKIVIPMHFGVPKLAMSALAVSALEERFDEARIVRHKGSSFEVFAGNLPVKTELHVLKPERAL